MKNFKKIWKDRIEKAKSEENTSYCFDYNSLNENSLFSTDNYNDYVIKDFLDIIYLFKNEYYEEITNKYDNIKIYNHTHPTLMSKSIHGELEIILIPQGYNEFSYFIIKSLSEKTELEKVYCLSIYKNRNSIDNFININNGNSISLLEFTYILKNLELV